MDRVEKSIILILPDGEVMNFLKMFLEIEISRGVSFVVCPQNYTTVPDGEKLVILTVEIGTPALSLLEGSIKSGLLSVWKHCVVETESGGSYFTINTVPSLV
jgi:hypothetical protein